MPNEPELRDYLLPFLDTDTPVVIRMRHEPEPASARLLVSLGAGWIVDEHAPPCVRSCGHAICGRYPEPDVSPSAHDLLITRDCVAPGCTREAGNGRDTCDQHKNGATPAAAWTPLERSTTMAIATTTTTCKVDGCNRPAHDMNGPYAKLCVDHKTHAREARQNGTGGGMSSRSTTTDGYVARVRALLPAAKSLDQAKRKLDGAGSNEQLKAAFAEASRRATAVPNTENLEQLEHATKALRRGAPARDNAQSTYNDAERKFRLALGALVQDFRA